MCDVDLRGWVSKKCLSDDLCDVDIGVWFLLADAVVRFSLVDADLDGVDAGNVVFRHPLDDADVVLNYPLDAHCNLDDDANLDVIDHDRDRFLI